MSRIDRHQLRNGLWLVAEPIESAQSVAMSMLLPAGVATEPADRQGVGTLLAEMICRGAGDLDARAHSDALDQLGVQRGTGVETMHLRIGATMIGAKLPEALPLVLDMVRRPQLAEEALGPSRDLAIQAIDALEDEPQQKVLLELRQRHYPQPFGRSPLGRREHLKAISLDQVRSFWKSVFVPGGAVLGFAGRLDWPQLQQQVEKLLGDWTGQTTEPTQDHAPPRGHVHREAESAQVHIGVAYDAPPEPDPNSVLQRAAVAVLSGGMSGRLFTEVREKRGLCYSVAARYGSDRDRGVVLGYAGTTAPRAQETLDVMTAELRRLSEGVAADEFERAIVGMKSRLVMHGESTSARAHAIVADQYDLGRPRSLDDLAAEVDAVTLERLNDFVRTHRPGPMTVVTIGPNQLKVG